MADQDKSSKTEEPTERRRRQAFREGNFAKSQEISTVFGLIGAFLVILFTAADIGQRLAASMSHILARIGEYVVTPDLVAGAARTGGPAFLGLLAPVLLVAIAAGILAGGLQSGFKLTPKVLSFKLNKLNPVSNIQQKYGLQALVKFGIDLTKFLVITGVILFGIFRVTRDPIFYTRIEAIQVGEFIFETTLYLLSLLILALGFVALLDFLYQKHKTHEGLKMSKQEVKDERKQQEGDPQVKQARRRMARAIAQRQMFEAVPNADLIVTNPTHYAVALRYDRLQDSAPMVLAKGKNLIAQKIKELGRSQGVPIVENKPLAQGLYKIGEVGKEIPPEFFKVVAEVLAYVYRAHRQYFRDKETRRAGV